MANAAKILEGMRSNPRNWRIRHLETVAASVGISVDQGKGSHVVFRASDGRVLTVPAKRPIKPIYVRRFLDLLEEPEADQE